MIAGHLHYAWNILAGRKQNKMDAMVQVVQERQIETIIATGISGITIASVLSYLSGVSLCVVRKKLEDEPRHSGYILECNNDIGRCMILDDFPDTGATIQNIFKELDLYQEWIGKGDPVDLQGIIFYNKQMTFTPLTEKESFEMDSWPWRGENIPVYCFGRIDN
jgi:hypoxanthine phosphoribosyltransferase